VKTGKRVSVNVGEFIETWSDRSPIKSIKEERLWLRKGIRPLLSGQPDELLFQGKRAAVLDFKFGAGRVSDPSVNFQLGIYGLLAARSDDAIEEVTCQILSPVHDFEPYTYSRAKLDQLYQSVLVVINSLTDPGDPVPGVHCQFCPALLICPSRRKETNQLAVPVEKLPSGADAARLLETVIRVEAVCDEIKAHYKAQLEADPKCVPGWRLQSSMRRWIPNPQQALEHLIEQFSISEFLENCAVSVSDLERAWARKNGVPAAQVRSRFDRYMHGILAEKRIAPSLRQATPPNIQSNEHRKS
jgi:uncharacterized protein DUF2800